MLENKAEGIYYILEKYLVSGWKKLVLRAKLKSDYYEIEFFVKVNGKYVQCYDLCDKYSLSYDELENDFHKLYKYCVDDCGAFDSFTMTLNSNRHFRFDYHYDEGEPDNKKWCELYLN